MKRPGCFSVADRRVSKLRHDCQTARSQAYSVGRGERRTPTDQVRTRRRRRSVPESNGRSDQTPTVRLVSSGRSDQPRPSDECPATEAINPDRQTNAQRLKRSTPTARLVSSGRRAYHSNRQTGVQREKGLSLQPPDVGRERRAYHSVHRPVLLAKGLITPHRQHPSWATCSVHPGLEGRTPRFLGRETLEKPETASIITATDT